MLALFANSTRALYVSSSIAIKLSVNVGKSCLTGLSSRQVTGKVSAMATKQVWIDTDGGVDDAQGILIALADNSSTVLGISAVHGNTNVQQVAQNIARVLTVKNREDIPFYIGAQEAMTAEAAKPCLYHGADGLGNVPHITPSCSNLTLRSTSGMAASKLIEAANLACGELVIAAIGPLTNLAMACKLDSSFSSKIKRLIVMGGAESRGNITPSAEFNFHADPEAAHVVLAKFSSAQLHLVTWECSLRHSISWDEVEAWRAADSRVGRFMAAVLADSIAHDKDSPQEGFPAGYPPCDPLAVAVALYPDLVLKTRHIHCDVELQGSLTRGLSVFDWKGILKREPNVQLVQQVDAAAFRKLMRQMLL